MNQARIKKWSSYKRALISPRMPLRRWNSLKGTMSPNELEDHRALLRMERTNNEKGN